MSTLYYFNNQISIEAAFVPSQIAVFDLTGKELISAKNIDEVNKQITILNAGSYLLINVLSWLEP